MTRKETRISPASVKTAIEKLDPSNTPITAVV